MKETEIQLRAGFRYIQDCVEIWGLGGARPATTPGSESSRNEDYEEELGEIQTKQFRTCVGKMIYVALERLDAQFVIKEAARCMSKPTSGGLWLLTHLIRYM